MDKDGINQIFISPVLDEPMTVLETLAHELVHAIDDCKSGHGAEFQKISKDLKLTDCRAVNMIDYVETVKFYRWMLDDACYRLVTELRLGGSFRLQPTHSGILVALIHGKIADIQGWLTRRVRWHSERLNYPMIEHRQ